MCEPLEEVILHHAQTRSVLPNDILQIAADRLGLLDVVEPRSKFGNPDGPWHCGSLISIAFSLQFHAGSERCSSCVGRDSPIRGTWIRRDSGAKLLNTERINLASSAMITRLSACRAVLAWGRASWHSGAAAGSVRRLSSGKGSNDGVDDGGKARPPSTEDEFEDEFAFMDEAEVAKAEEIRTASEALEVLEDIPDDIPDHMAESLVESIVAATKMLNEPANLKPFVFSRHALEVLLASRMVTNYISAPRFGDDVSEQNIAQKVVMKIDLRQLGLSPLANAAVVELSKPRVVENGVLSFAAHKYQSSKENQAHAVGLACRLVAEAKKAVGEPVNDTVIESWTDLMAELRAMTASAPEDTMRLVQYIAEGPPADEKPGVYQRIGSGSDGKVASAVGA